MRFEIVAVTECALCDIFSCFLKKCVVPLLLFLRHSILTES